MRRPKTNSRRFPLPHATAGGGVVRAFLSDSEWVLAVPPPGIPLLAADLRGLAPHLLAAVPARMPWPGGVLVSPVPQSLIGAWPGPAVLHYRGGCSVIYCADSHVTSLAAEALSALASRAAGLTWPALPALAVTDVEIARVGHAQLPPGVHPAAAFRRGTRITIAVCSDLITPDLAAALASLCSAQCSLLARPGQGSRRNGPAGRQPGPDQGGFRLVPPPAAGLRLAAAAGRGRRPGQGQRRRAGRPLPPPLPPPSPQPRTF